MGERINRSKGGSIRTRTRVLSNYTLISLGPTDWDLHWDLLDSGSPLLPGPTGGARTSPSRLRGRREDRRSPSRPNFGGASGEG